MTTRRLYEIAGDVLAMEDLLLETGGEWTPEVEALFAEVEGSLESKVDSYAALIREFELDAEKWKAEEERVAAHRKARDNAAKRLKARLVEELVRIGREKVETDRFKVAVQRGPSSVEVLVDPALLPSQYRREIPATIEADKTALRAALKMADDPNTTALLVDGLELARLIPGSPFLRVR